MEPLVAPSNAMLLCATVRTKPEVERGASVATNDGKLAGCKFILA
jgi:hypothetical protein